MRKLSKQQIKELYRQQMEVQSEMAEIVQSFPILNLSDLPTV